MDRLASIFIILLCVLAAAACSPNYAVDLDGQGDFVEIQSSRSLQPSSAITLEAWTLPSENASISLRQPILSKGRAPGSLSYALWFQNGEVAFELSGTGTVLKASSIVRADAPDRGSWHHIAGTWNRSQSLQRLFIDGILRAEGTTSFDAIAYDTSAQVFIGGQDSDGDNASDVEMNGQIDEVRVWSVARSPHEIQVSMNQKLRGNEEGLEAYWQFDDGDSAVATDSTNNGNIGILAGDAHLTSSTVPVQNLSFEGEYTATFIVDGREDERHVYPMTITQTGSRITVTIDYSTPDQEIVEEGDGTVEGGTFEVVTKSSQVLQFYTGTKLQTLTTTFDENGDATSFQGDFEWFFQAGEDTEVTDTGTFSATRTR